MASTRQDPRTGNWQLIFWYGGKQFCRSCETKSEAVAKSIEGRVEETIRMLKLGRLSMPKGVDAGTWIVSDGKLAGKPQITASQPKHKLGKVCDDYLDDQLAKAVSTVNAERTHVRHLKRVLREDTEIASLTTIDLQNYVKRRLRQKHRGRLLAGKTIKKELGTLRSIWKWARNRDIVDVACPLYDKSGDRKWAVIIPLDKEREKFQTWAEVERRIERAGLTTKHHAPEIKELWDSVYLDTAQVDELLRHVQMKSRYRFIYPMFVFAAFTGARRSEIRRSLIEDFNFETGQVQIRERKRRKDRAGSFRFVPMHPRLREVMEDWFATHPGGPYTIAPPLEIRGRAPRIEYQEMSGPEAQHHFKYLLKDSKWSVLRGWHVLRHSFGANAARSGKVSRDVIGEWMGHTTEEMKSHYQHLFRQDGMRQIEVALG
jgi:integrase